MVRITGPETLDLLDRLGCVSQTSRAHHYETSIDLGEPLGMIPVRVFVWPGRRSYTGQPSAEIHTFGAPPILEAMVQWVIAAGARVARPGEFTLRSFLAGRIDLTQAEAVLGVIDAGQRHALDHALRQLAGNLSRPLETMRGELLDLLADVEAGLDFVDEDIEFISESDLTRRLEEIGRQVRQTLEQIRQRGGTRETCVIAIRGEPNAGKSRLLNRLTGEEAAIVADRAGTTRDIVSVTCSIDGHDVRFVDTAGIESSQPGAFDAAITDAAQDQADRASREADIRIWCVDRTRKDWLSAAEGLLSRKQEKRLGTKEFWVATKCDDPAVSVHSPWIATSSVTRRGLDGLRRLIADEIDSRDRDASGSVIGTALRCDETLLKAAEAIETAIVLVRRGDGHEFVSAELRMATECLGEVTGAVYTDDILDRVFSRFCIGK